MTDCLTGQPAALLPGVVGFVSSRIIIGNPLASLGGRLQLPVVDLVEEHLSQLHDGLTLLRWQVAEFVLDKIVHPLFGKDKKKKKKEKENGNVNTPKHSSVLISFAFVLQSMHV